MWTKKRNFYDGFQIYFVKFSSRDEIPLLESNYIISLELESGDPSNSITF